MRRKLGQHFLKDKNALAKIAEALSLESGDTVIEIGAGHGELTWLLARQCQELGCRVIAIERDEKLAEALGVRLKVLGFRKTLEIIKGDILKILSPTTYNLKPKTYKVAGNIPYYITGHLLRIISELENKPQICVLTIQKEVALRITAEPPRMNRLAAAVQFWAEPEILEFLPAKLFSPAPEVESAVIKLKNSAEGGSAFGGKNEKSKIKEGEFYRMVRILFQQPRKTILNNLANSIYDGNIVDKQLKRDRDTKHKGKAVDIHLRYIKLSKRAIEETLHRAGLQPNLRPQNLSVEDIISLVKFEL